MAKRKQKQSWCSGDIFLIPLKDNTYSIGQIIQYVGEALNSVICAFFSVNVNSENECRYKIKELKDSSLISILFTTRDLLDSGEWKVVQKEDLIDIKSYLNLKKLKSEGYVGVDVIGSAIVIKFMEAFFGLYPWDGFYKSDFLDNLLISEEKKPKNIIYKENK